MRIKAILTALAATTMVASPVLAAANPAASLSISRSVRASAPAGKSDFAAPGAFVGLILAAAIIAGGIYLAVDDDDSDSN